MSPADRTATPAESAAPSPFIPGSVDARGVEIAYRERPGGPHNVLILHGWCCSPEFFAPLAEALPSDYRVIAMELWGRSQRPWGGWSISGLADQARDLADALGLSRFSLIGHSMGGVIAQYVALRYPERLDRLALLGTGPYRRGHRGGTGPRDILINRGLSRETAREVLLHFFSRPIPEEQVQRYVDDVVPADPSALIACMNSNIEVDVAAQLPSIPAPTLVIHAGRDYGRPREHAEALANGIPDARLVVMDTGHAMMVDDPTGFNAQVVPFLTEGRA